MPAVTQKPETLIRRLLESTDLTRDALPYSDEFERLYSRFNAESSEKVDRHQFWRSLSNAAKKGGWKGKLRGESVPELSLQQWDAIRTLACGKLSSRDSLAYTIDLDRIKEEFNSNTKLSLSQSQVWRCLCNLGKRSLRPIVQSMKDQSIHSLLLGIEHFNRPSECGRVASVLIMLNHASEMLLKAALIDRGVDIRNPKNGFTHALDFCLNIATTDPKICFLSSEERKTLQVLDGLRNEAQHFIADVSEQIVYVIAQSTVTLFADLFPRLFGRSLCEFVPKRVLPISVVPPKDIEVLMDDEFSQLKSLLESGVAHGTGLEAKLRSLMAIDRALELESTHLSDEDFQKTVDTLKKTDDWKHVFSGIAKVNLTKDGSGVDVSIRISKNEGRPVRIAKSDEQVDGVIVIKKVNDTEFYCLSSTELARKLKLTAPKTIALMKSLQLQEDPDCFKEIVMGKSKFKRYSGNALVRLKSEIPNVDIEDIWRRFGANPKKPR